MLLVLGACSSGGTPPPMDAGVRDSRVVDGDILRDSTVPDAAPPVDASPDAAADAGPLDCPGICDPRIGSCGAARACVLVDDEPTCLPTGGTNAEGETCTEVDQCAPGLGCFQNAMGATCQPICCPDGPDTCAEGMACLGSGVLVDGTETLWARCTPPEPCDVLDYVDSCAPGEGCYIVTPEADTECRGAGVAEAGQPCAEQNDCVAGLFCAGLTEPTCVRICGLGAEGRPVCPLSEGDCVAHAQSPEGSGLCTVDRVMAARR